MQAPRRVSRADVWQPVCRLAELEVDRGATALVHGQALAVFRLDETRVVALANHDPYSRTSSLARGIVGRRDGVVYVGSPAHGHRFDLQTGRCLDDGHVAVAAYDVQVVDGVVQVGRRKDLRARPA